MKKLLVLLVLLLGTPAFAQTTQKITEMTEDTSPTGDDLTVTVNAPGTSPANRKVTLSNLTKGLTDASTTTKGISSYDATDFSVSSGVVTLGSSPTATTFTGALSGNAATASALASDPAACTTGQYVSDVAADGTLTCGTPSSLSEGTNGIDINTSTINFDTTEVAGSKTWGDASTDTIVWTFDRATGTDPTMTIGNGTTTFSGTLYGGTSSLANNSMQTGICNINNGGAYLLECLTSAQSASTIRASARFLRAQAGDGPVTGIEVTGSKTGAGNSRTHYGGNFNLSLTGTSGTDTAAYGVYAGTTINGSGFTLTDYYAIYGNKATVTAGTLTNNFAGGFNGPVVLASNNADGLLFTSAIGSAADTNLYRSAANTLKTDDTFQAATALVAGGNSTSAGILELLEDTDDGTNYLSFTTAARASDLALTWNINSTICTGDGNGGALTINGSNQIVCSADDGGAGGSGDVTDVGDCSTGACFKSGGTGTSLYFQNATSGSVTLNTVAGALGTRTISLPAETGTVCTTGSVCSGYAPLSSPSFTTPTLGVASATSVNKVAITAPATSATLTIADGKTLTATNTVNLNTMTDAKWCKYSTTGTALDCNVDPVTDQVGTVTSGSFCKGDGSAVQCATAANAGTDITADLEEEVTEGSLANSTILSEDIKNGEIVSADLSGSAGITLAQTAMTAGRSLTISTNDVAADAELYTDFKGMTIETPTDADNFFVFEAPVALTVTRVTGIVEAATSAVLTWQECDSAGDNCSTIESVTADVDGTISTSIDNASIDAGDILRLDVGTVTGTVGQAHSTITFTKDD